MVKHGICILLGLLCILSFSIAGCNQVSYQNGVVLDAISSHIELASTRVPNVDIDLYLLAKQENPTAIPASMLNTPHDVQVQSLAIWGTVVGDELVLGAGVKISSVDDAILLNDRITMGADSWKMLSGDVLYMVYGSTTAREPLQSAIVRQDFKYFDDAELIRAASRLPNRTTDRPIAIGVIKPSAEFARCLVRGATAEQTEQLTRIIEMVDPRAIAIAAYSPKPLDVAEILATMQGRISASELHICALGLIESGRPGLLVESTAKTFLTQYGFEEISFGSHTLYRMMIKSNQQQAIPLLVWLNGNRLFASVAIEESYAQQLISAAIAANL